MAIITISRGSYSGGKQLAERLGEALNYRVVSREVIVKGAEKYGVDEQKLVEALESPPHFWDRLKHERRLYLAIVQAALCDEVKCNNVVYHGSAGHFLLKGIFQVIKVRVIAPFEYRAARVVESQGMSESEALKYIQKKDEERTRWTKFLYGVDQRDPSLYDIVINLEGIEFDCACNIVKNLAQKKDEKLTSKQLQELNDHVLASHVMAALALNPYTASVEVDVRSVDGNVYLSGSAKHERTVNDVVQEVLKIPGVKKVIRDEFVGLER